MDWREKYASKLVSMDEAVRKIKSGDTLAAGIATGVPYKLLDALADYAAGNLEGVEFYFGAGFKPYRMGMPQFNGHLNIKSFFYGPIERAFVAHGSNFPYQPVHLSQTTRDRCRTHRGNVLLMAGTEPDENGLISLGPSPMGGDMLDYYDTVIVQVNRKMPYVHGQGAVIPAERVTWLVEAEEDLPVLPSAEPSEAEVKIAGHIVERVPDGATIQLGIGGVASAIGGFLKEKRDLGIHTEMFVNALVDLLKCGAANNSKKTLLPGKTVLGFSLGSQEMYDFMDHNPDIEARPFEFVNDPRVIAQNDNMISINGAMQVDLMGQVCAESIGPTPVLRHRRPGRLRARGQLEPRRHELPRPAQYAHHQVRRGKEQDLRRAAAGQRRHHPPGGRAVHRHRIRRGGPAQRAARRAREAPDRHRAPGFPR